jgi:hypothetical protein
MGSEVGSMPVIVTVEPARKPESRRRTGESELDPGRFTASIHGRVVVASSRAFHLEVVCLVISWEIITEAQ